METFKLHFYLIKTPNTGGKNTNGSETDLKLLFQHSRSVYWGATLSSGWPWRMVYDEKVHLQL